ncbi:XLF-domain-containing protein [Delitschia confertaspora ATCC 74209]|uniref:Non-homologous end-joining factor 1 n=1 Tax=Delitschia confertaspora ATCC 74209 TaxID=1513339 RepID=A0A9P4JTX9_9PLEO|nr:XLF-domain-containing protein [Delitschia confertaspora ATCC 74209]
MSSWRLLNLTDTHEQLPQLLIRSEFGRKGYTIFLTDLCHIWREELGFDEIVERVSQEECPIEVSDNDSTQLPILLKNIQKSLTTFNESTCNITRNSDESIVLHTITILPEPLDALRWKFYLQKCELITLKNELVLPLLVNSQIQYHRISSLISAIEEKDKVITRLLDQYESSNLDLANAFPSVAGSKARRPVKREQAMNHVSGLRPFDAVALLEESRQLDDKHFSSTIFFQQALPQHGLKVSTQLRSEGDGNSWWMAIPNTLTASRVLANQPTKPTASAVKEVSDDETSDDDHGFEDEETIEKQDTQKNKTTTPEASSPPKVATYGEANDDETTDDDDLDAELRIQPQDRSRKHDPQSLQPIQGPPKSSSAETSASPRPKGFRIGGAKVKKSSQETLSSPRELSPSLGQENERDKSNISTLHSKTTRRPFRIGGKAKEVAEGNPPNSDVVTRPRTNDNASATVSTEEVSGDPSRKRIKESRSQTEQQPASEDEREETLEEKAERKRRELKRKNDELAKKQAHKKKKRF